MTRAGHEHRLPGSSEGQPGSGYRRLRDDPHTTMVRIAGEIGPRRATSLAEAKAAAYMDGRLRRAGMLVSADTFVASRSAGWDGLLVAALALLATLLYVWQPLPSVLLALWDVALAAFLARRRAPLLGRRRGSQNVVATRAATGRARWRVVLLSPLDSPPVLDPLARALLAGGALRAGRLIACALLAALGLAGLADLPLELGWLLWYAQLLPAAYLAGTAAVELSVARRPYSPGAVSHAGALAALLAVAETTDALERVELWAVALGTTALGAGTADLLRRYPFDREATLFVSIEGIGVGSLCFVTGGDGPRARPADPLLAELAHAAAAEPQIEAGPRLYRGGHSLAGALRCAGMRSLAVMCLDAAGRVPLRHTADDAPDQVDAAALERAAQLVAGIVRRLDTHSLEGAGPSRPPLA